MEHWLDRLALRSAAGSPEPVHASAAGAPPRPPSPALSRRRLVRLGASRATAHLPLVPSSLLAAPRERPFSRLDGVRALGLGVGLLGAGPLIRPTRAAAASLPECEPACLAAAHDRYRRQSIACNSGLPEPSHFLATGALIFNPLCQVQAYQRLINDRRRCVVLDDCGRKQPPPPAPPPPKRGPTPQPPGGCAPIGMTNCEGICCPAGYLCSGSICAPPPTSADQCNPPCPPGKKCQKGQCVDVSSDCGTCPPGAKCCSGCSYGAYCAAADFECRC